MPDDPFRSPDTRSLAWQRQEEAATICRDCYDGPLAIRAKGRRYLPQFPRELDEDYRDRLATSVFYPAFRRAVEALVSLVFREPPKLAEELPPQIKSMWENVDLRGTHGDVFIKRAMTEGEIDGHCVVFVDQQRIDPQGARTIADTEAAGLRPFLVLIRKQQVYGFRTQVIGGREVLTHFRYGETVTEPSGTYGEVAVERVREYNLVPTPDGPRVAFRVHTRVGEGDDGWEVTDEGVMAIDEIPAVAVPVGDMVGVLESNPPLLSVALENIKHYQLTSDNDNALHVASIPQFVLIGSDLEDGEEGEVSVKGAWKLPVGGDAKYVEPAGTGLEAAERRIDKSEKRMATLSASLLWQEMPAERTATERRLNKAETDASLSAQARAVEDAFEEVIRLSARWLGIELPETGDGRWVALNRDFENRLVDAQLVSALSDMQAKDQLTLETLLTILKTGNILPATLDVQEEIRTLEERIGAALAGAVASMRGAQEAGTERAIQSAPELPEAA